MVTITEFAPVSLDGGVTISTAAPTAPESFVAPTAGEARKLQGMIYRLRPCLDLRADRDFRSVNLTRAFGQAFLALSWTGRRGDVDHSKSIEWWRAYAIDRLRDGGIEAEIPYQVFLAAVLAHGDIPHSRDALGLALVHTGIPAACGWRSVLKSGAILPSSPEQQAPRGHEPGSVRVYELALPVGFAGSTSR